jgi:sialidase-1
VAQRDASPTDLVLKRSTDGGRSWGAMQRVVIGQGEAAIMNPCPLVDGDAILLFCLNAHQTAAGRHRHLLLRSADDGATWSAPADITEAVGDDTFISGPGVGLRMRSGRLVIPGYTNVYAPDRTRLASYSGVVFSDDGGRTWRRGAPVDYPMSNESQAVELDDGSLMLCWRIQKKGDDHPGFRGIAVSHDGGATWSAPRLDRGLPEWPCQAGLARMPSGDGSGPSRLIFSNPEPNPGKGRSRLTVRASEDGGRTWPIVRLMHEGPAAYSTPAVLPDGRLGLLYECGEQHTYERIRFASFSWDWLGGAAGMNPHIHPACG